MTYDEKVKFLKDRGWHTWYNDNYWVNTKTIKDRSRQDYTNYGMPIDDAYDFEVNNREPFTGQLLGYLGGLKW